MNLLQGNNLPNAVALYQFTVAMQFPLQGSITQQINHHRITRRAQLRDLVVQGTIIQTRRAYGRFDLLRRQKPVQLAQVHAESGRRSRASEALAEVIISPAQSDRIVAAGMVCGKHHTAVIVVTAQVGEVYADT